MAQSTNIETGGMTMSEADQVDTPEAAERIRVSSGTVSPETRERLLTLKAKRYLKYRVSESVEGIVQVALEAGMQVLEQDLEDLDPAA